MSQSTGRSTREPDEALFRLRACAALFTALEEALIAALSDTAKHAREVGAEGEAERMEGAIRTHRVGLVKYRAVMAAHGLGVPGPGAHGRVQQDRPL